MLKSANIEGEDEEEEKIQDMEGLYISRPLFRLQYCQFRLVRPRGIIPVYPCCLKIALSVFQQCQLEEKCHLK